MQDVADIGLAIIIWLVVGRNTTSDLQGDMRRFSLRELLVGMTVIAIGCGMLATGFRIDLHQASKELLLNRAFLIAFGGTAVGFGLSFPIKWPPHRMMCAMLGMFAAQAWDNRSGLIGLVLYGIIVAVSFLSKPK